MKRLSIKAEGDAHEESAEGVAETCCIMHDLALGLECGVPGPPTSDFDSAAGKIQQCNDEYVFNFRT